MHGMIREDLRFPKWLSLGVCSRLCVDRKSDQSRGTLRERPLMVSLRTSYLGKCAPDRFLDRPRPREVCDAFRLTFGSVFPLG